jgi:phospholipase/carboxylesterase
LHLETLVVEPIAGRSPAATVFVLHGRGADCHDLVPLAEALELPWLRYVFANAPLKVRGTGGGRQWYEFDSTHDKGLRESTRLLVETIGARADAKPVVLLGFSQGAVLALSAGLSCLPPPAAIVALSGYYVAPELPAERGGVPYPPVLIVHGERDPVIPVQLGREALVALANLGAAVDYREFSIGHEVDARVVEAVHRFLVETLDLPG